MDVRTALGTLEQVAVDQVAEALRTAGFLVVVRPRVPRRRLLEAAWCLGSQDGSGQPQERRSRLIRLTHEELRTFAETLRWEEVLSWVDDVFLPEYLAALSEQKARGLLAELARMTPGDDPGIAIEPRGAQGSPSRDLPPSGAPRRREGLVAAAPRGLIPGRAKADQSPMSPDPGDSLP